MKQIAIVVRIRDGEHSGTGVTHFPSKLGLPNKTWNRHIEHAAWMAANDLRLAQRARKDEEAQTEMFPREK